jgi:hypothetical protein
MASNTNTPYLLTPEDKYEFEGHPREWASLIKAEKSLQQRLKAINRSHETDGAKILGKLQAIQDFLITKHILTGDIGGGDDGNEELNEWLENVIDRLKRVDDLNPEDEAFLLEQLENLRSELFYDFEGSGLEFYEEGLHDKVVAYLKKITGATNSNSNTGSNSNSNHNSNTGSNSNSNSNTEGGRRKGRKSRSNKKRHTKKRRHTHKNRR